MPKLVTKDEYDKRGYIIVKVFQKKINTGIPELDIQLREFLMSYWKTKHSVKGISNQSLNELIEKVLTYDNDLNTRLDLVNIAIKKSTFNFGQIKDTYELLYEPKSIEDASNVKVNKNYTF